MKKHRKDVNLTLEEQKKQKEENLKTARNRAASKVRELIKANNLRRHYVLTYADNMENKEQVLRDFNYFIQRLQYQLDVKVDYLAVLEIQEERKKKFGVEVWHIHFATNRYLNTLWLGEKVWKNGICRFGRADGDLEKVAGYLAKYFKKDCAKYEIPHKKRYLSSQGLKLSERETGIDDKGIKKQLEGSNLLHMTFETSNGNIDWFKVDKALWEQINSNKGIN